MIKRVKFSTESISLFLFFIELWPFNQCMWKSSFIEVAKLELSSDNGIASQRVPNYSASLMQFQLCIKTVAESQQHWVLLVLFLTAATATHHCWWWYSHLTLLLMKVPAITTTADGTKFVSLLVNYFLKLGCQLILYCEQNAIFWHWERATLSKIY